MIKAIETIYNGYRFRSRLEARWAVFFDALGIKYEYETEGFELKNGVYYLPDFYLPDFCFLVEIKGISQESEYEKLRLLIDDFVNNGKFCQGILLEGLPGELFSGKHIFTNGATISMAECVSCGYITFQLKKDDTQMFAYNKKYGYKCVESHDKFMINGESQRIQRAFLKAKQARFEYGETPKEGL